ncbi:Ceramide-1-phosphate transfer protein [Nymphon striatum]|nr:Ceramide-1-phosphate transfer protein [Nymphon striatum]
MSDHVDSASAPEKGPKEDDKKFNISVVITSFDSCVTEVKLDDYITAYRELYRFFQLMGSVFAFVASDVIEKVEILEKLRQSEDKEHYVSIESMIKHEKENSLLEKENFVNGSRTLLRLHRALEFIYQFIEMLSKADDNDTTSSFAQGSYKATLAQFHPWLLQKAALVAMYTLPIKSNLINKVCPNVENANESLNKVANACIHVYNITQKLYEHHDLLKLP